VIGLVVAFCLVAPWSSALHAKMVRVDGETYDIAVPGEFVPGELVVQARPEIVGSGRGSFEAVGASIAAQVGGQVKATIPQHNLYLIRLPSLPNAAAQDLSAQKAQIRSALQTIRQSPLVRQADYNYKKSLFPPVKRLDPAAAKLPTKAPLGLTGPLQA
jgi:hypothetical protein